VIILWAKYHFVPLFVVRIAITQQQLAQFTPLDRRYKIQIMEMRFKYSIVQIREILVEMQRFLLASSWSSFGIFLPILTTCLAKVQIGSNRYSWIGNAFYTYWQWFTRIPCWNWPDSSSDLVGCWFIIMTTLQERWSSFHTLARPKDACVMDKR
jgi:hypothetical protein